MVELKPWLEVARPHQDIRDGSFDEGLFAADLGLVAAGRGPTDYLDPKLFAQKTYLTKNLQAALVEVGNRLAGEDVAAVYRMQTEFGGGKTHTLLAAYHLFGSPAVVAPTSLGRDLARMLRSGSLPKARVAVLDGGALGVVPEEVAPGVRVRSFLGHLIWRLGGADMYERVRAQDEGLLGTSTVQMVELLEAAAPCLILLDETLQYLSKALAVQTHEGNLAATTLTVIKELCTAAANVKGAAVVATLTSSYMEDYSTVADQDMQERLSKVVGRTENIVTPVEGDDIFPILHTRLFETVGDPDLRRAVADAYGSWYEQLGDALPSPYRDPSYRDRIENAYPFHPELIDILTNRWGSLSGFQRTRGALRTLAHTVKVLTQRQHQAALIHPGDVSLADAGVRGEVIRFAGESYKAAMNADIIREDSKAVAEDRRRGGEVERNRIAVGLATTAFLNSFGADRVLGASAPQMLIGVARPNPGLSKGVLDDIRDALAGSLWYMRYEGGRYRFTTEPNLNKVIVEREGAIGEDRIIELLRETAAKVAPTTPPFRVELNVTDSTDIADEPRLTIGLLASNLTIGPDFTDDTSIRASDILNIRGNAARTNRNAVVLVAADQTGLIKARQTARNLAALRDISRDQVRLNRFNKEQREQLTDRLAASDERLPQQLAMAYRHLVLLGSNGTGNGGGSARVDIVDLGPARVGDTVPHRVIDYLKGTDRLLDTTLAPAALLTDRFGVMGTNDDALEIERLYTLFFRLPRLPKLADADVLRRCLAQGASNGTFGLASGSTWHAPDAVIRFNEPVDPGEIQFQPGTWLVRAAAMKQLMATRVSAEPSSDSSTAVAPSIGHETAPNGGQVILEGLDEDSSRSPVDPTRVTVRVTDAPADKVRDVVRSAVMPLATIGADVEVTLKVTATRPEGIPRNTLDLVITEGLRQLGVDYTVDTE